MNNDTNIPTYMQSSIDPTQISTTITSVGKMIAGAIAFFAVVKGVDPAIATQQWGSFVQLIATGAPAAYTVWYTAEAVFGMIRKCYVWLFVKKTIAPVTPVSTQKPTQAQPTV